MTVHVMHRHCIISGRVQGVGYRAFAERQALARGLQGFVRNRRDGSVEALLVGEAATIEAMLTALRRGPPGSRVDGIDVSDAAPDALKEHRPGERFSVLRTV
jgi:acylphosphatase